MAIKTFKPTTPSRRHMTVSAFEGIDKKAKPERSLVESQKKHAGRNSYGRITVRHRGGGNKVKYRIIDFKRDKTGVEATVAHIEYDPNRTCRIALIEYKDGEKSYILAPTGLQVGMKVESGQKVAPKVGNAMPLKNVPLGTSVHNIEIRPGSGGKVARAAGQQAYDILVNGADPATTPIFFFDVSNLSLVINEENAAELGITIPEELK